MFNLIILFAFVAFLCILHNRHPLSFCSAVWSSAFFESLYLMVEGGEEREKERGEAGGKGAGGRESGGEASEEGSKEEDLEEQEVVKRRGRVKRSEEKMKEKGGRMEVGESGEEDEEEEGDDRPVEAPHRCACLIEPQKCSIRTGRILRLPIGRCSRAAKAP